MVSKKVYQDRIARGVCVRCGNDRQGSSTNQCLPCVAKAKAKRDAKKPTIQKILVDEQETFTQDVGATILQIYGDACCDCQEPSSDFCKLQLVVSDINKPDKRTPGAICADAIEYYHQTHQPMPGYQMMCSECCRIRAVINAGILD